MRYMMLIHHDEARLATAPQREFWGAYAAFTEALGKADGGSSGPRLEPATAATTVRSDGTRTEVLDGPHAEARETFAGYFFVEADTIEGAVEWAARCPSSRYGSIEIRAVADGTGG